MKNFFFAFAFAMLANGQQAQPPQPAYPEFHPTGHKTIAFTAGGGATPSFKKVPVVIDYPQPLAIKLQHIVVSLGAAETAIGPCRMNPAEPRDFLCLYGSAPVTGGTRNGFGYSTRDVSAAAYAAILRAGESHPQIIANVVVICEAGYNGGENRDEKTSGDSAMWKAAFWLLGEKKIKACKKPNLFDGWMNDASGIVAKTFDQLPEDRLNSEEALVIGPEFSDDAQTPEIKRQIRRVKQAKKGMRQNRENRKKANNAVADFHESLSK